MWRIYYNPDNGNIKYQINASNASLNEILPYVDFEEQQLINNKSIDLETLLLIDVPPYTSNLTPPKAKDKTQTKTWVINKK